MAWYVALWTQGPIIVASSDEPRLTLTYFTARSNLVPYAFIWGKLLESHLMEDTAMTRDKRFVLK